MDLSEESQKRERFQQILRELAKSQDVLKEKKCSRQNVQEVGRVI